MSLALEFEAKLEQLKGSKGTAGSSNLKAVVTENKLTAPATNQPYVTQKSPLRITDAEKQSRFLKGECFRCGDKYGPGHRCKTGALQVYEMEQEPKGQQYVTSSAIEEITEDMAEISLHAILGKQQPTAMKVYGLLGAKEVLVLVDGGSTHNFISDTLVRELNLATENIRPIGVQIGNGDVIRCNQVCKDLKLQVQELEVMQDFYPFSLGGADIVLGIRWLATLNTVHANWREMSMVFSIDNKRYKLQGVPTSSPQSASFQYFAGDEGGGPTRPQLFQDFMQQSGPAPCKNGLEDKSLFHGGRIDTYLGVTAQGEEAVMCCPRVQHVCAPETN